VKQETAAAIRAQQEAAAAAMRAQAEARQRAHELSNLINSLEKVDDDGRRTTALDAVCPTEDVLVCSSCQPYVG
jgi:SWI/SNF-related matrix-associated actin-dependent regulator of chromatin subfamily A3